MKGNAARIAAEGGVHHTLDNLNTWTCAAAGVPSKALHVVLKRSLSGPAACSDAL